MKIDSSNLVQEGYDKIAPVYHEQRNQFKNQSILELFSHYVGSEGHILDLGCGSGVPVAKFLLNKGIEITGIDISQSMLDLARKNIPSATLIKQNMRQVDFPKNTFDGVVCFYALYHVPRVNHRDILKNIFRMLKPGGVLVFSIGSSAWEGVEDFHGTQMYWSHYAPGVYGDMLEEIGFDIVFAEDIDHGEETHFWFIVSKGA